MGLIGSEISDGQGGNLIHGHERVLPVRRATGWVILVGPGRISINTAKALARGTEGAQIGHVRTHRLSCQNMARGRVIALVAIEALAVRIRRMDTRSGHQPGSPLEWANVTQKL